MTRPHYYYLFPEGHDFVIRKMTDEQASELWKKGERWVDVGKKTRAEAEQVRQEFLKDREVGQK